MRRALALVPLAGAVALGLACAGGAAPDAPDAPDAATVDPGVVLLGVTGVDPERSHVKGLGYITPDGEWVVPPVFRGPERIDGPTAAGVSGGECVLLDRRSGALQRTSLGQAKSCVLLADERVAMVVGKELVVVDGSGTELARLPHGGRDLVVADGDGPTVHCEKARKCGYLGADGAWVVPPTASDIRRFASGRGAIRDGDGGTWRIVDGSGAEIKGGFAWLSGFSDGAAVERADPVCAGDDPDCQDPSWHVHLIDASGQRTADLGRRTGPEAPVFSGGFVVLTAADDADGYEVIDDVGRVLRRVDKAEGWLFSEGLAAVPVDGGWAYVDSTGKTVHAGPYALGGRFQKGFAKVGPDTWLGRDGKEIRAK